MNWNLIQPLQLAQEGMEKERSRGELSEFDERNPGLLAVDKGKEQ